MQQKMVIFAYNQPKNPNTQKPYTFYDSDQDQNRDAEIRERLFCYINQHVSIHIGCHIHTDGAAFSQGTTRHGDWKLCQQYLLRLVETLDSMDPVGEFEPSFRALNDLGVTGLDLGVIEPLSSFYEKMSLQKNLVSTRISKPELAVASSTLKAKKPRSL